MTYLCILNNKRQYLAGLLLLALLAGAGCRKELVTGAYPDDSSTASLNYFGISQTFPFYSQVNNIFGGIGVFVDTAENSSGAINTATLPGLPFFEFNGTRKQEMYPYLYIAPNNIQPVYLDYTAGNHRFIFAYMVAPAANRAVNKPVARLADTSFNLPTGSHNCLYFTDAPAAEGAVAAYQLIRTQQPLKQGIQPGKVSVRFVHLSADAGNLRFSLLKADGSEADTNFPKDLPFGESSPYVALDPDDATDNLLVLKVYDTRSRLLLSTAVPDAAGHSFEVLVNGMVAAHQRQVVSNVNADGSLVYRTVTLPISLGATVRQTY